MVRKQTFRPNRTKRSRIILKYSKIGALLLINVGVSYVLINQITPHSQAQTVVLGTETVAPASETIYDASDDSGNTDAANSHPEITIYTVKSGDSISGIAQKYHITTGTIYAANDLTKNQVLKVGQKLVILPIAGIQYTVKSGDTISGIAHTYGVPANDILDFNDLEDAGKIKVGVVLIIPNAESISTAAAAAPKSTSSSKSTSSTTNSATAKSSSASSSSSSSVKTTSASAAKALGIINPVPGSTLTQGLHDVNAVDLGAPTGTTIIAAKAGTVIVAKNNGAYNGGFGNFVVIDHGNMQTLYAHMSKVEVTVGETVDQGQEIGKVGSTGKATGPHTHFEIHGAGGAKNPFAYDKKGTHY